MKRAHAIRIAIASIEREIKSIAVDANLHDLYKADYPHAIKASKRRTDLRAAIEILKEPQQSTFPLHYAERELAYNVIQLEKAS